LKSLELLVLPNGPQLSFGAVDFEFALNETYCPFAMLKLLALEPSA
jgi:hypothetical protein